MAYTAPKQYGVEAATSSDLNTYQRDNLSYLHDRECCVVHNGSTAQSVTVATWTAITFSTEHCDTDGMHSTSSNTSRITIPNAGIWLCSGQVTWASMGANHRCLSIGIKHSSESAVSPSGWGGVSHWWHYSHGQCVSRLIEASDGYVELFAYQGGGSGTNAIQGTAMTSPVFSVIKIRDGV